MSVTPFLEHVDRIAAARPDATAILFEERQITFAALADRSRRMAGGMVRAGIGAGDRVVIWMPNRPEWIEIALACARIGAIAVAANTRLRAGELADILIRTRARMLVIWPSFGKADFPAELSLLPATSLDHLKTVIQVDAGVVLEGAIATREMSAYEDFAAKHPIADLDVDPDSTWMLFTTSGTTSKPKFVMHSHRAISGHQMDYARALRCDQHTVIAVPHPISGMLGFTPAFGAIHAGVPLLLASHFDPVVFAGQMRDHRVTNLFTIDEALTALLKAAQGPVPFPDFRFAVFGALNGKAEELIAWADRHSFRCVSAFGMTEAHSILTLQRQDGSVRERARSGGYALSDDARFRIVDPETRQPVAAGGTGELEIASPWLFTGYFENEEATRNAMTEDGFYRTGDLCVLRPDGELNFLSRIGDSLRLKGFLVNPLEISTALVEHPAVGACEVVGLPSETGMKAVAFVVTAPSQTFDESALAAFCRRRLAGFKVPERFFELPALPVTEGPNGPKVKKADLRTLAADLMRTSYTNEGTRK